MQDRYRSISLPTPSEEEAVQVEDAFMKKVQGLMEAHLGDENFGIPDLCQAFHMSRAQLYRKFNALTGQPIGQYLRSFRLHRARKLLEHTDLNISEIAFKTGYKDPAYFTRSFKREFGINPIDLRQ